LKKRSKRQTLKVKYKVEKKVKVHNKKMKKEAKKVLKAGGGFKNTQKGLRIPNLYPHKKQLIEDLQRRKQTNTRKEQIDMIKGKTLKHNNSEQNDIEQLIKEAEEKELVYEQNYQPKNDMESDFRSEKKDLSKKAFMKELKDVIENSDVILEVLDCRDPLSCRSKELESQILSHKDEKKIILILNKIDLVPKENALKWQTYLKREFPTLLFRANTQNQGSHLASTALHNTSISDRKELVDELLDTKKAVGAENLLQLLKNYCRIEDSKKHITVGIVGFPNVGKSSIINSLKRSKVASVSNVPGHTRVQQEIVLDKNIKLIDCPGVVFSKDDPDSLMLKNVVRVEDLNDPISVVEHILRKIDPNTLVELYEIPKFNTSNEFLAFIARKRGKLIKGGTPDFDKSARLVLKDWNDGKIKFFTNPPEIVDNDVDMRI